jgi:hypothetical protein
VGLLGFNRDKADRAADETAGRVKDVAAGGAVERGALASSADAGGLSGAATKLIERLLDIGIDGRGPFDSAASVAETALKHSRGDVEQAVKAIRRDHRQLGAVGGFATGLGGFFTMPISLPANILEFYLLATRMTAATAKVRGYDLTDPAIRSAILLTLVGADGDDILKKAGLTAAGGKLSSLAFNKLPAPALMVLNKAIGFRLLGRIGGSAFTRLGRAVPVVGGALGAGVDVYMLGRIGAQAAKEFPLKVASAL